MPKLLVKSRLPSNKYNPKIEPEMNKTKPSLPRNLQSFKQNLLSGNGYIHYK